jgi:uncharacterized protein YbbK (DUF523 family)
MNLLVSSCLLGVNCRYDGGCRPNEAVRRLSGRFGLIPVCPEQMGGLPTPRPPAELRCGRAVTRSDRDVTEQFLHGAEEALKLARLCGCRCAVLKSKSPSCGCGLIHDGTFSGALTHGDGLTAGLLRRSGIVVLNEENAEAELLRMFPEGAVKDPTHIG